VVCHASCARRAVSETQLDTAVLVTVPASLTIGQTVPVVVTTTAGGGNSADFIPLAATASAPYNVSPQNINLLVGQTRTISVTDASGNVVTGLEWTTSNASVVSLSSDDPPVITAVAPGTAIVYVVGMPILVTVYAGTSLPAGAPIWSVPLGSGGPGSITVAPAVPSASGADLFTFDSTGTLTALSSDGSKLWRAPSGPGYGGTVFGVGTPQGGMDWYVAASIIPDFSGGVLIKSLDNDPRSAVYTHNVQKVDAATGQYAVLYTFSTERCWGCSGLLYWDSGSIQTVIPHPSGRLFIQDTGTIILMDPSTGQQLANVSIPAAHNPYGNLLGPAAGGGKMIVAGDGNAYVPYQNMLLRFSPDGTYNEISLGTATADYVITNGDSGVAVFGDGCGDNTNANCYTLTLVSNDVVTSQSEFVLGQGANGPGSTFSPTLQREDGSYIGADTYGNLFAIGLDGSVLWQQQITTAPPGSNFPPAVYPLYATADGGVIVTSTTPTCPPGDATLYYASIPGCLTWGAPPGALNYGQLGTLYTLDANGNVTSQQPDTGAVGSWTGEWTVASGGVLSDVGPQFDIDPASFASQQGGNPSQNGVAVPQCPCEVQSATTASASNLAFPKLELAVNSIDALGSTLPRLTLAPCQTQAYDFARPAFRLPRSFPTFDPVSYQIPLPDFSVSRFKSRRSLFLAPQPAGGSSNGYLIMVGNPGGAADLFQLAADTQSRCLTMALSAQACSSVFQAPPANLGNPQNTAVIVSVNSDPDFNNALVNDGQISGGVYYYGHGYAGGLNPSAKVRPAANPANDWIYSGNVSNMSPAQFVGGNVTVTLRACHGGQDSKSGSSIAQLIANKLNVPVYAWREGMFLSKSTAAKHYFDPLTGIGKKTQISPGTPVFLLPDGGTGILPCKFEPHQQEPLVCNGH
jgi:hypothetical protein